MIRVYVDMVADLFHSGHVNFLKQAKECGDYLIVGVHSDKDVASYKRKPIIGEKNRCEMIKSCRYVDEVVDNAPLMITKEFIDYNEIDFVIHGDDINSNFIDFYKVPVQLGVMKYVPYTKGISTSEIIKRIKEGC